MADRAPVPEERVRARNYSDELAALGQSYKAATKRPIERDLSTLRAKMKGRPLIVVANGGATPAAIVAARWHMEVAGEIAHPMTSQEFLGARILDPRTIVLVLSAQARHPDTRVLIRAALALDLDVVLMTQRNLSDLSGFPLAPRLSVLNIPQPGDRDGFLATNSLLITIVTLARLYGFEDLPPSLPKVRKVSWHPRPRLIVLNDSATAAVGRDIETRFSELGLASVQAVDYRTLAHGRHFGLHRNASDSVVVALLTPESSTGRATLKELPAEIPVVRLETEHTGIVGLLELLLQAMSLPVRAAALAGVEIHRPGVPKFGRRLYHLSPKFPKPIEDVAVRRKLGSAQVHDEASIRFFETAFARWRHDSERLDIGAVVLDYDGTLVATADRYSLPTDEVQRSIVRLLELGLHVAMATGRGDSLHREMRKWVPKTHWQAVTLGLHNGSWIQPLSATAVEPMPGVQILEAYKRLRTSLPNDLTTVRRSGNQINVTANDPWQSTGVLLRWVESILGSNPVLDVSARRSGHSVDVLTRSSGKASVVTMIGNEFGPTLAVGDQGNVGGNDFDLLAATTFSISVDQCSPDPSRCWAPAPAGYTGPPALTYLIDKIARRRGGIQIRFGRQ
jgi:hypothetical protein